MPATRDYYSILQLNPSASQEGIDAAYQRLSRLYDPDTSQKRRAIQRKEELDEAYEVLSDPRRRTQYDRMRSRGYRPGQTAPSPSESSSRAGRAWATAWGWLDNPYVFAGIAGGGVMVILVAIVLISLAGGGSNEAAVLNPSPSGSPGASAPAAPPPLSGEPVTTSTGLKYIDTVVGTGDSPALGQKIKVNYTGWLEAGNTKFDSSIDRGQPAEFVLGEVIPGWNEGLQTMKVGGSRRLIIPGALGYGANGSPPKIPPDATLIFDIDLIDVLPSESPPSQPSPTAEVSPSP